MKVYLLRHGETQYNADGNRYCGRTDIPLTHKGLHQAALVAEQLNGIKLDAVYSSPLERAAHTARIASGRPDIIIDRRLIEVDFGTWEGQTRQEFVSADPASWEEWNNDPSTARAGGTGETGLEVVQRVNEFYTEISSAHADETVMVVGHNGINRLFLAYKLGMPLRNYRQIVQENSALTLIEFDLVGTLTLMKLNSHS